MEQATARVVCSTCHRTVSEGSEPVSHLIMCPECLESYRAARRRGGYLGGEAVSNYHDVSDREGQEYDDPYEDGPIDGVGFAGPGSALRAATKGNPRNLPCPTCKRANRLTPLDRDRGYQCDSCADADERGGF